MAHLIFWLSRVVSVLCVAVLVVVAIFDAKAARFTAGKVPAVFTQQLDVDLAGEYQRVIGVAHNAGDDLAAATRAVAYGADAIEIDVRSAGSDLLASHDAPVPFLQELVFRGPSFGDALEVAQLQDTVLLHLKERSPRYLNDVRSFLRTRPMRKTIVQTSDPGTLRALRRTMPKAQLLLLVLDDPGLARLRRDPRLLATIDGVSVRESLLSAPVQAWLERRRLLTFAWTVNDEQRMNTLVAGGVDGLMTDRLDIMQLLGEGPEQGG